MNLCILFLLISAISCQKWSDPSVLYTGDKIGWNPSIMLDKRSERIQALFTTISRVSMSLNYVYMNVSDGDASDVYELFNNSTALFYPKHDIKMFNYSTALFAALTTMNISTRKFDILYSETPTAYVDWSQPRRIVDTGNDTIHRMFPTVLHCEETGRLWVFYYRLDPARGMSLAYVTRPQNSSIFSSEHIVLSTLQPTSFILVNYTMSKGKPTLHMFFTMVNTTDQSSDLIYMSSTDNGVRWSFANIADVILEQKFEPINLLILPEHDLIIVSNIDKNDTHPNLRLTMSSDYGKKWVTKEYEIRDEDDSAEKVGMMVPGRWNNMNGLYIYISYYEMLRGDRELKDNVPYTKGTLKFIPARDINRDIELKAPFKDMEPEIVVFPNLMSYGKTLIASASVCKSYPFTWCEMVISNYTMNQLDGKQEDYYS